MEFYFQVPVQVFGIDGRYATALYTAGTKLNKLTEIENDLTKLQVISEIVANSYRNHNIPKHIVFYFRVQSIKIKYLKNFFLIHLLKDK